MTTVTAIPTLTITNLTDLLAIRDEAFTATFIKNITKIFEYQTTEISKIFEGRKQEILKILRLDLFTNTKSTNSDFANRSLVSRKKNAHFISDIIALGEHLTRSIKPNLESILKPDSSQQSPNEEMEALSEEIRNLREENKNLKLRLARCERELGLTEDLPDLANEVEEVEEEVEEEDESENENEIEEEYLFAPPIPDQATPEPALVYVGNCDPSRTRKNVLDHITKKIKVKISLSDITEIASKYRNKRAFKVAVPQNKLHQVISYNWPANVIVNRWRGSNNNNKIPTRRFPEHRNQRRYSSRNGQKFRNTFPRSFKPQNDYIREQEWQARNYYKPEEVSQNHYWQSSW